MQATRGKVSLFLLVLAVLAAISPASASLLALPDLLPQQQLHQIDVDRLQVAMLEPLQAPATPPQPAAAGGFPLLAVDLGETAARPE